VSETGLRDGRVILDWLSFTLPFEHGLAGVEDLFGEPQERKRGMRGYSHSASVCGSGAVGWAPERPEQGVHVDLPSSALARAGEADRCIRDVRGFLIYVSDLGGKFSRVDFALDDREKRLDMGEVREHVDQKWLVSRWRTGRHILGTLDSRGQTIYLGSGSSDSQMRIYDKRLEEMEKRDIEDPGHWIRVEVQFRRERAKAIVALYIAEGVPAVVGVIRGLVEFKKPSTDGPKSRWEVEQWWSSFLEDAEKRALSLPRGERTLDKTKAWLERQVAPSMAFVVKAEGGSVDYVYDLIHQGNGRLAPWQTAILGHAHEASEG